MITKKKYGTTAKTHEQVDLYTLKAGSYSVSILTYGGVITSLLVPDKQGNIADVVLGYGSLTEYEQSTTYFGFLIGRFANRIRGGQFSIEGKDYQIPRNDNGINTLHGGPEGLHTKVWDATTSTAGDSPTLHLALVSPDGDMGFPGNLTVNVDYTLFSQGKLEIAYRATTDQATPLNLTNHSYFNLAGDGKDIRNHILQLDCDAYIPVDATLIPTGEVLPVVNTPFDFTKAKRIGEDLEAAGGYDHCMVLSDRSEHLRRCASVTEPTTGRTMTVSTTLPGVQFYTGNFLNGSDISKNNVPYNKHAGFCLETQHFPNAMNHANFPNCILKPTETYKHTTVFEFNGE